ncbi:MAG: acyl-CoA hydrolase [Paraglaciecola sp.]|jgi:acyl-CoA hydrolase
MIMVAVDEEGQPTKVPKWQPTNENDVYQRDYALRLMTMRKTINAEMAVKMGG